MGIQVEFNPDLALRDFSEHEKGKREIAECIPKNLKTGKIFPFLKRGQRNYWLFGELPLLETKGGQKLSKPIASIVILETTHFIKGGEIWTKGKYKVIEKFSEGEVRFNGFAKI